MAKQVEFMGRDFGDGHFIGDKAGQGTLYLVIEQGSWKLAAEMLGWSEACPVVPKVIAKDGEQGAAETYAELLLTRQAQLDIIKKHNPTLAGLISSPKRRVNGEAPGKFVDGYIPLDHADILRPPATLVGYNLPRLTREYIGPRQDEGERKKRTQKSILDAFSIFERAVETSTELRHTPIQFMVNLAEDYAIADGYSPKRYLRRLLSTDKIKEDNLWTEAMITLVNAGTMDTSLHYTYIHMPIQEQERLGIAVLAYRG